MSSPKKNVAYDFTVGLIDSADTGSFKANPTLATGDFQISKDNGAYANLATLPTVAPAGSINVKVALSQTEMNADKVIVKAIDVAGAEWDDVLIFIDATEANVDDVTRSTTPANTLDINATGEAGSDIVRVGGDVQSATDLKDFADAGYDPSVNKVEGVKTADVTTTNSDMRGTDSAALAAALGTPANIDGGGATIADNLKKMADDNGGATFDATDDSLNAIRDRGDIGWITGGGGGITDILNVQPLVPNSIDLANTATVRIALGLTNMLDDLPSTVEITPGTISIDRKAIGGTSWSSILSDVACSEAAGLIYYDEVFDSGTGYVEGDTIRVTFKNQKITVAANDYEITGTDGWIFHTSIRETMRGTDSAATASALAAAQADLDIITDVDGVVLGEAGVDLIIDEVLTGATHNVVNSLGRRIRELADLLVLETGTLQSATASTVTLAAGANANNNFYDHAMLVITGGTGEGQARAIDEGYVGATKVAPIAPDWVVTPDGTSEYSVYADTEKHVLQVHAAAINAASFAASAIDAAALAADAAAKIVDAWEAQSQADPTGFHVNVKEVNDTAQAANDNSADIIAIKTQTDDQPAGVKKNVALDDFTFLMVNSADHFTPKTGLTITATISLDGAAFGACTNSAVEISSGVYKIDLTQAEMNADTITLKFTASGADQRTITILTSI